MEINPKPTQSSSGEGIINGGENITFGQGGGGQRKDVTGVGGPSGAVIGVDMSRTSTPGAGPSTTPLPSKAGTPGATPQTPATAREEEDQATADSSAGRSWEVQLASRKRKWGMMGFTKEEQDIMEQDSLSLQLALAMDQEATLYPPPPTAFSSYEDAVQRLLPYHVWQVYDEELDTWEKADVAKETKEAADILDKIKGLKERFAKARRREDDRLSPLPSTISFFQSSTTNVREELTSLQTNLRTARAELSAIEQEQKKIAEEKRKERMEEEGRKAVAAMAMQQAARQQLAAQAQAQNSNQTSSRAATPSSQLSGPSPVGTPTRTGSPPKRGRGRPPAMSKIQGPPPGSFPARAGPSGTPTASGVSTPVAPGTPQSGAAVSGIGAGRPPGQMVNGSGTSTPVRPSNPPPQGPVSITVNLSLIPQLVAIGLIAVPPNTAPGAPKPPGIIIKSLDDKKSVVIQINLAMCSKPQLLGLAKVLNVNTVKSATPSAPSTPGGSGSGSGAGPSVK
ncbi:hypothetical protein LQV05_004585 [Cryptococcus neoformans]|nr:hypothetical protein J007_03981 [Cryptococcus neoformans var. grubii]OXC60476.1 hypothetical protein C358_04078 [Cryptococcus neoformans var. grubii MW-RSA852]UOH81904.1 hypothetical protein LQV05_004585 [Cryptococcus neoformans]